MNRDHSAARGVVIGWLPRRPARWSHSRANAEPRQDPGLERQVDHEERDEEEQIHAGESLAFEKGFDSERAKVARRFARAVLTVSLANSGRSLLTGSFVARRGATSAPGEDREARETGEQPTIHAVRLATTATACGRFGLLVHGRGRSRSRAAAGGYR